MKKLACIIGLISSLLIGFHATAAESYKLGMLPIVGWSYYKVAEVKGFWEKQGITVELVDYATPIDTTRGGIQRLVDMKPSLIGTISNYRDNGVADAVYLGTLSVANHHKYLILKENLRNQSLKGKTIGTFLDTPENTYLLANYLNTVDTKLEDVRLVAMNPLDLEANFTHGRLEAVLTLDRGNEFYTQSDGFVAVSTRDFYEPHGLVTLREDPLNSIPREDMKKILRGCVEAIVWQQDPDNWEEFKAILKDHFLAGRPEMSDEQIREVLKDSKTMTLQDLLEHNQQTLIDYFTQFRAFLAAEGMVQEKTLKDFTHDSVIANQELIDVLQEFVQ